MNTDGHGTEKASTDFTDDTDFRRRGVTAEHTEKKRINHQGTKDTKQEQQ